jgi:hypothetical protein
MSRSPASRGRRSLSWLTHPAMWAGFRAAAVDAVIAPIAAWSSFQPEHDAGQECLADEDARQRTACGRKRAAASTTPSSRPPSRRPSASCSQDARPSGPQRSPATLVPGVAAGSAAARRGGSSTPRPSPSPWSPPCATSTRHTTACSWPASRGRTPAARSPTRSAPSSIPGGWRGAVTPQLRRPAAKRRRDAVSA